MNKQHGTQRSTEPGGQRGANVASPVAAAAADGAPHSARGGRAADSEWDYERSCHGDQCGGELKAKPHSSAARASWGTGGVGSEVPGSLGPPPPDAPRAWAQESRAGSPIHPPRCAQRDHGHSLLVPTSGLTARCPDLSSGGIGELPGRSRVRERTHSPVQAASLCRAHVGASVPSWEGPRSAIRPA